MKHEDRAVLMLALRNLRSQALYLAHVAEGACRVAEEEPELEPHLTQLSADLTSCAKQSEGLIERMQRETDPL